MFFRAHAVCQANFCKDSDFQVKRVLIKLWIRNECSRGYRKESVRANGSRLHLGFTHCSVTGRPSPCSPAGLLCSIIPSAAFSSLHHYTEAYITIATAPLFYTRPFYSRITGLACPSVLSVRVPVCPVRASIAQKDTENDQHSCERSTGQEWPAWAVFRSKSQSSRSLQNKPPESDVYLVYMFIYGWWVACAACRLAG